MGGTRHRVAHRAVRRVMCVAALAVSACAPKAPPLVGTPVPVVRIPDAELPPVHRQLTFDWSYRGPDFRAKGDGAARVAPPDSVRLDFFVGEGMGGGRAVLIGDELAIPGDKRVRAYLPPVPLLWAALGRLHVPPAPDTVARVDGDTLRVEIGREQAWRATFVHGVLRRLEQIAGGRIPQWLARDGASIRYEQERQHRTLELTIVRVDTLPGFDAAIWR